jgi:hypothetical protein
LAEEDPNCTGTEKGCQKAGRQSASPGTPHAAQVVSYNPVTAIAKARLPAFVVKSHAARHSPRLAIPYTGSLRYDLAYARARALANLNRVF